MTLTLDQLREQVKLNMDERCFSIYKEMVEPNIKAMLRDYLRGWQDLDNLITRITMRSKGAYKTDWDVIFSEDDDVSKYEDKVVLQIYRETERLSIYEKIEYLHDVKVLKDSTRNLLHFLRKRRNKIHGTDSAFSDVDRLAFSSAHGIMTMTHIANLSNFPSLELKQTYLNSCEIQADNLLKWIKNELSDSQ